MAFKAEVPSDLPRGRADERRLTQVLLNLIGNAIKFTDSGEVVITAASNDGSFNVSVRDTGPGISMTDQAQLFQEFQQADNSITRKKGGTGLGLAISKRIIEMHGGKIWIDSCLDKARHFPSRFQPGFSSKRSRRDKFNRQRLNSPMSPPGPQRRCRRAAVAAGFWGTAGAVLTNG
jgi:signal transduction histidine kinase